MALAEYLAPSYGDISDYDRLVAVKNPNSTRATESAAYLDDLVENTAFKCPVVVESQKDPSHTAEKLAEVLRDGDLVYLMGGDGLANNAAQFLGSKGTPQVATMFAPLGNACNAYHATIRDKRTKGQPSKALRHASIESIYPLRTRVEGEDDYTRLALSIVSVGAIATGAAVLDQPQHRKSWLRTNAHTRLAYETAIGLHTILAGIRTLEIADPSGHAQRQALDVFAANAPKIAKIASFNTEITDHEFLHGAIKNRLPQHLYAGMARLVCGMMPVVPIPNNERKISFRLTGSPQNQGAMIEFDGEAESLKPNSLVTIDQPGHNDFTHQPIPVITAR